MNPVATLPLEPLAYHVRMIDYLQAHEADLWKWFAEEQPQLQQNDAVRLELLKSTYRVERDANAPLYDAADEVAAKLDVEAPPTFYQSQHVVGLNASLAYMPAEPHIVLTGPVTSNLTPVELRCLLGHELLHFALLDRWREYRTAERILAAMSSDDGAETAHIAAARLFRLYAEVYCDRGAWLATKDVEAAVTMLVKIETGMTEVSAAAYLRQTDEIFEKGHPRSEGLTHPEAFVRARALQLWTDQPDLADADIKRVIEGPVALEELDLLGQRRQCELTRRLVAALLKPAWLRTEPMLAHAKLFFDDFEVEHVAVKSLAQDLDVDDAKMRDYYVYVLLDFAVADRELEEAPLAASLLLADALGLGERFRQVAVKELNLRKKQMESLETDAADIVAKAAETTDER